MTARKLEELLVWQKSVKLCKVIYQVTKAFPAEEKYNLIHHMRECSRNVPGNIAEGYGRYHFQESSQFYRIARGSINELKSDVYVSFEVSYISDKTKTDCIERIEEIIRMLNSVISSTQKLKRITNSKQ